MSREQEDASFAAEVMAGWQKYYEWERAVVPAEGDTETQNGVPPPPWAVKTPPVTPDRRQPAKEKHSATRATPRALPPYPEERSWSPVANVEARTRELEAETHAQSARLAVAQGELEAVRAENRGHVAKVSSQERENKLLLTKLEEQDDLISGLRKQIATFQSSGNERNGLIARKDKEIQDLQAQVAEQRAQNKNLQDHAKAWSTSLQDHARTLEESREGLERQRQLDQTTLEVKQDEILDLREKLEKTTQALDKMEQQVSSLQAARDSLDGYSRKTADELDAKDAEITDLKLQWAALIKEQKQEVTSMDDVIQKQKADITALMAQVEDLQSQSELVKSQLASMKTKADDLVMKKVSLEAEAVKKKEESDAQIAELETRVAEANIQAQALAESQATVLELRKTVAELEAKSRSEEEMEKALTNKIAKLQSLLDEANMGEQVNELKNQVDSEKSLRADATQKQIKAEEQARALTTEKEELKASLAAMKEGEEQGKKAVQRVQELEKELGMAVKELDATKADRRNLEAKAAADGLDSTVLKAQIAQQRDVIDTLSAELSSLRGNTAKDTEERQRLRNDAQQREANTEKMKVELEMVRSELEKAREDRLRANQQREEAERDVLDMQRQLEEMQAAHNRSVVVATETAAELGGFRQDVEMQVRTLRGQLALEATARRAAEEKTKAAEEKSRAAEEKSRAAEEKTRAAEEKLRAQTVAAEQEPRKSEKGDDATKNKVAVLERELQAQKRFLDQMRNEHRNSPARPPPDEGRAPTTPNWRDSPSQAERERPWSMYSVTRETTTQRRVLSTGSDDEENDVEV